jgi:predicted phosphodiesterase
MRFAAISDVHGNIDALKAVLADIERQHVTETVNLGDHLSGPLAAAETADLLMSLDIPSIRGNCDRELVETPQAEMELSDRQAFAKIKPLHIDWLRNLPATHVFRDEVFMCHGTPASDMEYWLERVGPEGTVGIAPVDFIRSQTKSLGFPVMLCGHTHIPRAVQVPGGPLIVNPGSVGLPAYDTDTYVITTGSPCASYAIIENSEGQWGVTFRLVPYENRRMVAMAKAAGRPEWANAIATGWL